VILSSDDVNLMLVLADVRYVEAVIQRWA